MEEIEIECKGIGSVSVYGDGISITLQEVGMLFLEDLPSSIIVGNHNNEALLKAMDYDDICEYLESQFYLKITKE